MDKKISSAGSFVYLIGDLSRTREYLTSNFQGSKQHQDGWKLGRGQGNSLAIVISTYVCYIDRYDFVSGLQLPQLFSVYSFNPMFEHTCTDDAVP